MAKIASFEQLDLFTPAPQPEIEIWKDIPEWEGLYQASTFGRIRVLDRIHGSKNNSFYIQKGFLLSLKHLDIYGYPVVNLNDLKTKRKLTLKIHRLVALTFLPNPNNYPQINHINGIKTDNRIENLEWCTPQHNIRHSFDMKLNNPPRGEEHFNSKLTDAIILEIRRSYKEDGLFQREIAKKYGVSQSLIALVVKRKTWEHV
jgi:hypothetical protein